MKNEITKIVYYTIDEWSNNPRFKKCDLESYDNWKDDLIDKICDYIEENYTTNDCLEMTTI